MPEMTDDQAEHAASLLESYTSRLERHRELFDRGEVAEDLASFFAGLASKHETAGILQVHFDRIDEARSHFGAAAEWYGRSARENEIDVLEPKPLAQGCYAAALAGDREQLHGLAQRVLDVVDRVGSDPPGADADRYFFPGALAGAILGSVDEHVLDGLEAVNASKSDPHDRYGRAILEFAHGVDDDDPDRIREGVESMVAFHDRDRHPDNVVDLIVAPQATALVIVARQAGYDVRIESEFVSRALVDASVQPS